VGSTSQVEDYGVKAPDDRDQGQVREAQKQLKYKHEKTRKMHKYILQVWMTHDPSGETEGYSGGGGKTPARRKRMGCKQ
jgi:hypothetical protein